MIKISICIWVILFHISCSLPNHPESDFKTAVSKQNIAARNDIANDSYSIEDVCIDSKILASVSKLTRQNQLWENKDCETKASSFFNKVMHWMNLLSDFHAGVTLPLQLSKKVPPGVENCSGSQFCPNTLMFKLV